MSQNNDALTALTRIAQVVRTRIQQAQANANMDWENICGDYSRQKVEALTEIENLIKDELYRLMIQTNKSL